MVTIKNVSFFYDCPPYILNHVNIEIPKGSYTSIIGDNGSCKSTIIKLILGLIKPKEGEIIKATSNIGYVPQWLDGFNSQFPITVKELLLCHLKALKIKDKNIVYDSLKKVNMLNYENSLIGNLSGGQKQKILICRALLGKPELLILDELSTGIDVESQKELYKIIKELNISENMTVVAVEHNMDAVAKNSDIIYKLKDGVAHNYDVKKFKETYLEREDEL